MHPIDDQSLRNLSAELGPKRDDLKRTLEEHPALELAPSREYVTTTGFKFTFSWQLLIMGGIEITRTMQLSIEGKSETPGAIENFWTRTRAMNGVTALHFLALSGDLETLQRLIQNETTDILDLERDEHSIADYAARSLHGPRVLSWIKETQPTLIYRKDRQGRSLLVHQAILANRLNVLEWIDKNTSLLDQAQNIDVHPISFAITSGKVKAIEWFFENRRDLIAKHLPLAAHYAARFSDPAIFTIVMKHAPRSLSLLSTDKAQNFLHAACIEKNTVLLIHLLKHFPSLVKKLWVPDGEGHLPDYYHYYCSLHSLRDEAILAACQRIALATSSFSTTDTDILLAFKDNWLTLLQGSKLNDDILVPLFEKRHNLPFDLMYVLCHLPAKTQLRIFSACTSIITKVELEELYKSGKEASDNSSKCWFFQDPVPPKALQHLNKLLIAQKQGNLNETTCFHFLHLLVHDYHRDLLGTKDEISDLVIKRLSSSITLEASHTTTMPFEVLMDQYIQTEFVPYARVIYGRTANETDKVNLDINEVSCFILNRHNNQRCLSDNTYALTGYITPGAVAYYFKTLYPRPEVNKQTLEGHAP